MQETISPSTQPGVEAFHAAEEGTVAIATLDWLGDWLGEQEATDPLASLAPHSTAAGHWWLQSGSTAGAAVVPAWAMATGSNMRIAVLDTGINGSHLDLSGQGELPGSGLTNGHGTRVAGMIVGRVDNQIGGMGVAPEAELTSVRLQMGGSVDLKQLARDLATQAEHDLSNNSWGFTSAFADNFRLGHFKPLGEALALSVTEGRGGLGSVIVHAAGNGRMTRDGVNIGDDSNFHNMTNSRHTIAVGASDAQGRVAAFSSPGTNLLLSAPGTGLLTADGLELGATGSAHVAGTSYAAPMVSGTVALMLGVNPGLGHRDVQDILALTARPGTGGAANAATGANGGGLVFDRDIGFGILDTAAAVRLAAHWTGGAHVGNEHMLAGLFAPAASIAPAEGLPLPGQSFTLGITPPEGGGLIVEWAELTLNLRHTLLTDLRIELISPSGTHSLIAPNLSAATGRSALNFTFSTAEMRGEAGAGVWTLRLSHPDGGDGLTLNEARLDLYGRPDDEAQPLVFTDAFIPLAMDDPARRLIGHDTAAEQAAPELLFAAASSTLHLDLAKGSGYLGPDPENGAFTLNSTFVAVTGSAGENTILGASRGERLTGGNGDDHLEGRAGSDHLIGGMGQDRLLAGSGQDVLTGGAGADVFIWDNRVDIGFRFRDRITDFTPGEDKIDLGAIDANERLSRHQGFTYIGTDPFSGQAGELRYDPVTGWLSGDVTGSGTRNFSLILDGAPALTLDDLILDAAIRGTRGHDVLQGGSGNDTLSASAGRDTLTGGEGADVFIWDNRVDIGFRFRDRITDFTPGEDKIDLGAIDANERLSRHQGFTYIGTDPFSGQAGELRYDPVTGWLSGDVTGSGTRNFSLILDGAPALTLDDLILDAAIRGTRGHDVLQGGSGNDTLSASAGRDTLTGGEGADVFLWSFAADIGFALRDRITDFTPGEDKIDLSRIDADLFTAGNQSFTFIGTDPFSGRAGELRYDPVTGWLSGDITGSGSRNFSLILDGAPEITFDDLIL